MGYKGYKSQQSRKQRKQNPSGRKLNSCTSSCPHAKGMLIVVVRWANVKNTAKLPIVNVSLTPSAGSGHGNQTDRTDRDGYWTSPTTLPLSAHQVKIALAVPENLIIVGGDEQSETPSQGGEIVLFMIAEQPKLKVEFVWKRDPLKKDPPKLFKELPIKVTSSLGPSMDSKDGVADFKTVALGKHILTVAFCNPDQNKFDFLSPTEEEVQLEPGDDKTVVIEVEPLYTKVVFVGHCLLTIAKQIWKDPEWTSQYNGLTPEKSDIDKRVQLLGAVIRRASGLTGDKEDELKVFVVPECFFLGRNGAYSIEALSGLIEKLQDLVKEPEWKHWVFAFGTVNGVSEVAGKFSELFNIAPVIRGGFQSPDKAPDYTRLIQKTFYSAEMPTQRELFIPIGEQPEYGEKFSLGFGATEYEYIFGRLVRELLAVVWDNEREEWTPKGSEPRISSKDIDAVCCENGKKTGDWAGVRKEALNQLNVRGMTCVVRDVREGKGIWGGELLKEVLGYYVNSKTAGEVPADVTKPQSRFTFYPEDFTFRCARKPGPWLEGGALPQNRKVSFGLEICADHSQARVKNARSDTDREIAKISDPAVAKLALLRAEKRKLDKDEKDLTKEKSGLEKIVGLVNGNGNDKEEANKMILDLFQEKLDPTNMAKLLEQKTDRLEAIKLRKPKMEEELEQTNKEMVQITSRQKASGKQKELDIQLVPSAGMILLPQSIAVRPGGYAFNCDGWNASSAQLAELDRTKRRANIIEIMNKGEPPSPGHNPLHPHSEVLKDPMTPVSAKEVVALTEDASEIFAEGPGQLHVYPPQDLPN